MTHPLRTLAESTPDLRSLLFGTLEALCATTRALRVPDALHALGEQIGLLGRETLITGARFPTGWGGGGAEDAGPGPSAEDALLAGLGELGRALGQLPGSRPLSRAHALCALDALQLAITRSGDAGALADLARRAYALGVLRAEAGPGIPGPGGGEGAGEEADREGEGRGAAVGAGGGVEAGAMGQGRRAA